MFSSFPTTSHQDSTGNTINTPVELMDRQQRGKEFKETNNERTPLSSSTTSSRINHSSSYSNINKSFLSRSNNSIFSPSHGRTTSTSTSGGRASSKGYLITVIPPSHLPHDPPHPRSGACSGYGPQFMRGCLVPLYPSLASQLGAIAREYGLLSTGGLVLYLVSIADSVSLSTSLVGGPRISEEAWSILFGRLFEEEGESEEDAFIPPVPISHRSNMSNLHNLHDHGTFSESHPEQEASIVSDGTEFSAETSISMEGESFGSRYSNTTAPIEKGRIAPSNPSTSRSIRSNGSQTIGSIVGKIEFDIDRRKAKWYDGFLAAAAGAGVEVSTPKTSVERVTREMVNSNSPRGELQLVNLLDKRNNESSTFSPMPTSIAAISTNLPVVNAVIHPTVISPLMRVRSVGGSERRLDEFDGIETEEDPFRSSLDKVEEDLNQEVESDHSSDQSSRSEAHGYAQLEDEEESATLLESEDETATLDDIFPSDEATWRAIGINSNQISNNMVEEATGLGISGARIQERSISGRVPVGVIEHLEPETEEQAGRLPPQDDVADVLLLAATSASLLASPIHLSDSELGPPGFTTIPAQNSSSIPSPSVRQEIDSAHSSPRRHSDSPKAANSPKDSYVPRHAASRSFGSSPSSPSNLPYARSPRMGNYFSGVPELLEPTEISRDNASEDAGARSSRELEDLDDLERVLAELSPKREKKPDFSPIANTLEQPTNATAASNILPVVNSMPQSQPLENSASSRSTQSESFSVESESSTARSSTSKAPRKSSLESAENPELSIPLPPSPAPKQSAQFATSPKFYPPASEQPYLSNYPFEEPLQETLMDPKFEPVDITVLSAPPVPAKANSSPSPPSQVTSFAASKLKALKTKKSKNGLSISNTAGPNGSQIIDYKPERAERSEKSPINSFFSRLKTKKPVDYHPDGISSKTLTSPVFTAITTPQRVSLDPNAVPFTLASPIGRPFDDAILLPASTPISAPVPSRPGRFDSNSNSSANSTSYVVPHSDYQERLFSSTSPRSDYGPPATDRFAAAERNAVSAPSSPAFVASHQSQLSSSTKRKNDLALEDLMKTMKEINDLEDDFDIGVSESSNSLSTLSASGSGTASASGSASAGSIGSLSYSMSSLGKSNPNHSLTTGEGEGEESLDMR